jgi:transposase
MLKVRIVKTGSGSKAVQVIEYRHYKRKIWKHLGSTKSEEELIHLVLLAEEWIKGHENQLSLFEEKKSNDVLYLNHCEYMGIRYRLLYETITTIQTQIGYSSLLHPLLHDLVIIRLLAPASKLRSIELLDQHFGRQHNRKKYYRLALQWLELKDSVEAKIAAFAESEYSYGYDLLFYDVTTLYFESFEDDELRKKGFSKDKKSDQVQILVALVVSKEGFPIAYEIFEGNTFEGHTFIPAIQAFIQKHTVKDMTVVADAAMINDTNIEALRKANIHYILGARLGNLGADLLNQIDTQLIRADGNNIRLSTNKGYLICSFSALRYRKDKNEMDKQIKKAQEIVANPSKKKRVKFTLSQGEQLGINQKLITKATNLLGIKGYYTDLSEQECSSKTAMERYHELYRIEQAFRVSKTDLRVRPIFHFKKQPIQLHMLICFMALTVAKHIELKTKVSIRRFLDECKKIADVKLLNQLTSKEVYIRGKPSKIIIEYLNKLNIPH